MKDFFFQNIPSKWSTYVIQGYVESFQNLFIGKDINLVIISRRRFEMAGTRFNTRGIDEDGNAANFVETEMIVEYPSLKTCFTFK